MNNRTENSRKCIIWGAGYCGGIALEAYGHENVFCFADSDVRNIGLTRWGKIIISYEEMIEMSKNDNIRIVAASEDFGDEMEKRLLADNIVDYDLFRAEYARDIVNDRNNGISPLNKRYKGNVLSLTHPELKRFKGLHSGKRIFLVGNGPSLQVADLDKLYENHEICFGFNNIYKIYDRTKWRPDYYSIVDFYSYLLNKDLVKSISGTHFLWDIFEPWMDGKNDSDYFFHYERKGYNSDSPEFSEDIVDGTYLGYTSVYDIGLQFAAYMGASEIYLLGVDHNYPNKTGHEGNHFEGYIDKDERRNIFFPVENTSKSYEYSKVEMAFKKADSFSKSHGFRIYNATRGGKLDIFERVDFDKLF